MKWILVALFATLLPLLSCEDSDVSGTSDGKVSLSIYLTDAAGDVESVWVQVLGVSLQSSENGPVQLGAPTEMVLLTDLVGTTQLLVSNAELDPGNYNQLRLLLGDVVLLSKDGTVYVKGDPDLPEGLPEDPPMGNLQCPSCSQSGLKVTIPNDAMTLEGGDAALILDFDVAQSFGHIAGKSGKWVMHPVIHGTLTDQPASGLAIEGTVQVGLDEQNNPIPIPPCPTETDTRTVQDFIPNATIQGLLDGDGNPVSRSGVVAEDGSFTIGFLPPGTFDMGYAGAIPMGDFVLVFTATVEPAQVTLTTDPAAGIAYTITSAVCQAAG